MRNEPWVWPEVRDAGTSGAGAVPLRSAHLMGQQKKKKKKKKNRRYRTGKSTVCRRVLASFSPEILQVGTVKGLIRAYSENN